MAVGLVDRLPWSRGLLRLRLGDRLRPGDGQGQGSPARTHPDPAGTAAPQPATRVPISEWVTTLGGRA